MARIDTLLVPLVVWVASLRPAKKEARATIGLCEIKAAMAIKEGRRGFQRVGDCLQQLQEVADRSPWF